MVIGDVAYVLVRFVITPLSIVVLILGIVLYRRASSWSVVFLTAIGELPFVLLATLEATGQLKW